jgi:hypothetical protein
MHFFPELYTKRQLSQKEISLNPLMAFPTIKIFLDPSPRIWHFCLPRCLGQNKSMKKGSSDFFILKSKPKHVNQSSLPFIKIPCR